MSDPQASICIDTESAEQTALVGTALGCCCAAGDVVAMQGELGAGKTQFVRGLAEGLGLNPRHVSSPTFVMAQEYEPVDEANHAQSDRPILVHIDAYRIKSEDELASIGWHGFGEELRESAVVAIEWAALIRPALGDDVLWVEITHEPHGRRITLTPHGNWSGKIQQVCAALRAAQLDIVEGEQQ